MPRTSLALALLFLYYHLAAASAIAMPTELPSILQVWDGGTLQWNPTAAGSVRLRPEAPSGPIKKRNVLDRMRENPGMTFIASLLPALVVFLNVITA